MDLYEKMNKTLEDDVLEEAVRYVWCAFYGFDIDLVEALLKQNKISLKKGVAILQVGTERIFSSLITKMPKSLNHVTKNNVTSIFEKMVDDTYSIMYTGSLIALDVMDLYNPDYEIKLRGAKLH